MKRIYIVRRHRLMPAQYQGAHRRVYAQDYTVVCATGDAEVANGVKRALTNGRRAAYKYSIGRLQVRGAQ